MKILITVITTVKLMLNKWFNFFAALTSFVGLYIVFIDNKRAVDIALLFFCIMLLIFNIVLIYSLFRILEVRNREYISRSSFIKYETLDGIHILYENYKLIQSKKPIISEFEYGFKWSGTKLPVVTSDLQTVVNVIDQSDPAQYDKAILKFKKPIYYNKTQVIHFKAELDDTDKSSSPHLECRVVDELDIIHFRVILKHIGRRYNENAILLRKRINSAVNVDFEKVREIAFDKETKSYECHLINPEIGYFYRIMWVKV